MDLSALRYAKTHEWTRVEGDVATIGITDFAVKALTDLVYVDLPAVGKKVNAGDELGEVESVKAVSDIYAPVSGEVIEVNTRLPDDLDLLSKDAFGKGWMVKIRLSNPADTNQLMDRTAYEAHCAHEAH